MGMREDIMSVRKDLEEIKNESFASEILSDYKKDKKRLFIIILVILSFWFATIGAFVYYINTTGYEEKI